ncbi:MAG TPA: cbb3-type cytochrome c oxidase N-terminal domain-containing protein [Gemmatimonadales bacterium]|nr:cbb3-type cytochrome c oxidase N-terminal domain-containing protein [Gemmatimonadales bacterium]
MSEKDQLIEHEYDGIQEYDNPMPRWWVTMFWLTILFAVLYPFNIGPIGSGKGWIGEYEADVAAAAAARPAGGGAVDAPTLLALADDPAAVAAGHAEFTKYCAACHGPDGGGIIGPNLTDDAWLHGSTITAIHAVVQDGVLTKGMPAWGKQLSPDEINAVVAYIWTLRGTTPANPKAPQGVTGEP